MARVMTVSRWVLVIAGAALLGMATLLATAFYDRYWLHRDCFNDLGRCYESETGTVYVAQAGAIWGGATVLSLAAGLLLLGLGLWRKR